MSDPYRTAGRNGPWFVDSDGDMVRLDKIQYVYDNKNREDFPVTICFTDGTKYHISAEDGVLLKKALLTP